MSMENIASEGRAAIVAVTSEVSDEKCRAHNVLVEDPHRLWLSAQPAPQAFTLELTIPHPTLRFAGWHCWHDFPTNPQCVEILSSESLAPDAVWRPCLLAEGLPGAGTQLYELQPPIQPDHRYLRVSVLRTFGGNLVYMNRLFLFEACPVAHTPSHNVSAIVDRSPKLTSTGAVSRLSAPATPATISAPTHTATYVVPSGVHPATPTAQRETGLVSPDLRSPAHGLPPHSAGTPTATDVGLWQLLGAVEARLVHCERQLGELREERRNGVPLRLLTENGGDVTPTGIVPPPALPLPQVPPSSSYRSASPQEDLDLHLQDAVDRAVRASLRKLGPKLERRVVEAINEKLDDRLNTAIQRSVDAKVESYLRHMQDRLTAQMRTAVSTSGFMDPHWNAPTR